jgi:hypothetical protein
MSTINEVNADLAQEHDTIVALAGLIAQLRTDIGNIPNIPADVQAGIDAAFTTAEANKADLAAMLVPPTADVTTIV